MKKLILIFAAVLFTSSAVSGQVLTAAGIENTVWTGFGGPLGNSDMKYYGVLNTLQARVDIGMFTIDGMINWGAVADWNDDNTLDRFSFVNTPRSPLSFHYYNAGNSSGINLHGIWNDLSSGSENTKLDPYYVNFLIHPLKGFDAGVGTKLNWSVGPAPSYGSSVWEAAAHIREGGFSTAYNDRPGTAGTYRFTPDSPGAYDVVGFVPYANTYAKTAIGLRYRYADMLETGIAIPGGADTDNPVMNLGFSVHPADSFTAAFAYEGLFQKDGNLYSGITFAFAKAFKADVYFAWDSIDNDHDGDMSNGTGASLTINIPEIGIRLSPEAGINWFENTNYTPAYYVGGYIDMDLSDNIFLGAWTSCAWGAADRRWNDKTDNLYYDTTKDWTGGFILDIRPKVTFLLNNRHSLSFDFDYENRTAFDGYNRTSWSAGVYWTYTYAAGRK
jgi:hypothetical protein